MVVLVIHQGQEMPNQAEQVLTASGFAVISVDSAQAGVEFLTTYKVPISVVILDTTNTDPNGFTVLKELRRLSPSLPCIVCDDREKGLDGIPTDLRDGTFVISKPYCPSRLVAAIPGRFTHDSGEF